MVKFMRFLSIFMLIGFSIVYLSEKFPDSFVVAVPVIVYAAIVFLILAVGYLILHYCKRIVRLWDSMD
ncbi:hypothetical protein [Bacillus sp. Marseille-Q3570]|uniref:hypothetical protein n=1 Tax=Bacillus sp. Marseille-Q3570 TaxID=2963522 RepID=UPI0021B731D0|nr:hypothetical protein [Bacillus sp. Marseille-Q3570]